MSTEPKASKKKIPLVKVNGPQNHHLYKRLDVYWIRYYRASKGRLEESLKTTILTDARIARDKRMAEFLGQKPRFAGKGILLEDVWPDFIKLKEAKSAGTQRVNKDSWNCHLKDGFGHMLVADIDEDSWLKWVIREREKRPDRKFATERRVLQNMMNWLNTQGRIARVPKFEHVDPERNSGKVYTDEELQRLLSVSEPKMELFIRMGCEMMMRHGEIWSLEWSQIDLTRGLIHLPSHKTKIRRARTFAISKRVLVILKERRKEIESDWVFPSLSDNSKCCGKHSANTAWKRVKKNSKVKGRFHDLRHTGLTHAFKKSVNPALICEFAGLSLDEAQKTYLHFTPEDTRVVASLFEAAA